MTFGERFKTARRRAGKSQAECAKELGITRNAISLWESGATRAEGRHLVKVAQLLGVTPKWLDSGTGPQDVPSVAVRERTATYGTDGLREEEHDLVLAYRAMPEEVRTVLWDVIDGHLRRSFPTVAAAMGPRDLKRSKIAEARFATRQILAQSHDLAVHGKVRKPRG
jgi:transcriptional regulator with XRE-family HTH domain